jgi:3-dehydroquinate synthase
MKEIHQYQVVQTTNTKILQLDSWEDFLAISSATYYKTLWVIDKKIRSLAPFQELDLVLEIEGGETIKTLENWTWLVDKFAEFQLDRHSQVIAIGGGSISDLVGYAASVYLRGISFSIVPSTLLSLIDAGIGGKNGINFLTQKNQVGTIYQPKHIYIFPEIIRHLPREEMSDGFAEIIKYGLIMDEALFHKLAELDLDKILANSAIYEEIIHSCIIHKSRIVEEDPFEGDKRRILNFGHTIGHGIEACYGLSHGKSVALGICLAAKMSDLRNENTTTIFEKLPTIFTKYDLPVKLENFSADPVFEKIKADKKRIDNQIHFIFLNRIGEAIVEKITLEDLNIILKKAEAEQWIS